MIIFPNAKLNLGLNVVSKRDDGYHNIETVFLPVKNFYDILEVVPLRDSSGRDKFSVSGLNISCEPEDNLCLKAVRILRQYADIPPLNIFLHKVIPLGSGLGGGSADGAFMLKLLNEMFDIGLNQSKLEEMASQIGADCAFFIGNNLTFAEGIGNLFSPIDIFLPRLWVEIVVPSIQISTAFAYQNIIPCRPQIDLKSAIHSPIESWRETIINDFERPIFEKYTELKDIKEKLYENGALYASMSGSGSAVFGLFRQEPIFKWDIKTFKYLI